MEEEYLVDFYQDVAIPALLLGEQDRARGVMADDQRRRVAASALTLVANLENIAEDEASEEDEENLTADATPVNPEPEQAKEAEGADNDLPDGTGKTSPVRWRTWRTR